MLVAAFACVEAVAMIGASFHGDEGDASAPGVEPLPSAAAEPSGAVASTAERPPAAPAASATPAPVGTIVLGSGATMAPPQGATPTTAPGGIPPEVAKAHHAFKLEGGNRRLMVSELALNGQRCAERLQEEWARMERSKAESESKQLELRRVTTIAERQIAGRRVLWAESMQGTSLADAGAPFAATATALACAGEALLLVMYMATEPTLDPSVRPTIDAMLTSLRVPAAL
jgi:hypothetical protein